MPHGKEQLSRELFPTSSDIINSTVLPGCLLFSCLTFIDNNSSMEASATCIDVKRISARVSPLMLHSVAVTASMSSSDSDRMLLHTRSLISESSIADVPSSSSKSKSLLSSSTEAEDKFYQSQGITCHSKKVTACSEKIVEFLLNGWSLAHIPCMKQSCGVPLMKCDTTGIIICPSCNMGKAKINSKRPSKYATFMQDIKSYNYVKATEVINEAQRILQKGYLPTSTTCNTCGLDMFKHIRGYYACMLCTPKSFRKKRVQYSGDKDRDDMPNAPGRISDKLYLFKKNENGLSVSKDSRKFFSSTFSKGGIFLATASCGVCRLPLVRCSASKVVVCIDKGCPSGYFNHISSHHKHRKVARHERIAQSPSCTYPTRENGHGVVSARSGTQSSDPLDLCASWDTNHGGVIKSPQSQRIFDQTLIYHGSMLFRLPVEGDVLFTHGFSEDKPFDESKADIDRMLGKEGYR